MIFHFVCVYANIYTFVKKMVFTKTLWYWLILRMWPQWSHSKSRHILEKPYLSCIKLWVLQLSQLILDFWVYTQNFLCMRPQWSHSKSWYTLEKPYSSASNSEYHKSFSSFWIFLSAWPWFSAYESPMIVQQKWMHTCVTRWGKGGGTVWVIGIQKV